MRAVKNQIYSKFSPTNIPGCQLWLDAADTRTTGTGSTISTWSDKSLYGRDLTAYGGTTTNLTSGIFVQLGNSIMSSASSTIDLCNASFLIVCSANSGSISNTAVFGAYGSTSTQPNYSNTCGFGFYMDGNTNKYRVYGQYTGTGTISNTNSAIQSPAIFFTSYSSSGTINSYLNGQNFFTAAGSARTTPAAGFTIGGEGYLGSLGVAGGSRARIYEIIVYDSVLDTTEQQQVQGYLAYKWNLQSLLPAAITATLQSANRIAWYDASNASSVTSSGGILSQWNDLSGNANHLTVARGTVNYTTDSTYTTNNVVNFTSTSSHLRSANYITYTADTTEVYVVARLVSMNSSNIDMLFCMADDTTNANSGDMSIRLISSIPFDGNTGDIGDGGRYYVNGANSIPSTTATYSNSYFLISCKFAWTGPTTSRIGISSPNSIGGAGSIVTARCWIGNVAEVVVYSSPLTSAARLSAQAYFASKWSLPITTPVYTYSARPPVLKVFVPNAVTNCVLWLDAADSSTITASGTAVSAWKDKISGLSFTGTALIGTTTFNSLNTISFRRASSHYLFNSAFSYAISNRTTIFVWKADSTDTGNNGILSFASPYGSDYNSLNAITISTGYPIGGWGPAYIDANGTFSGYATPNNQQTTSAIFTEQNVALTETLYKNGSQVNIYSVGGSLIGLSQAQSSLTPSTGLVLGARYQGSVSYLTGYGSVDIAEVLCFSPSLSAFQIRQVEVYLANKWGLTGSLPADHKFYTNFSPYIIV